MDYATLKNLKLSAFSDAADGYRATSDMASAAKDRIEKQIAKAMPQALEGDAASAAMEQLRELAQNFHYTQTECGLASTALNGFVHDLTAAKKKLDAAVEEAHAAKYTVNSDGSITYPAGGEGTGAAPAGGGTAAGLTDPTASALARQAANLDPNPHYRRAQDLADRITEALQEATDADAKWAPKVRALMADDDLTVSDGDWADTASDSKGVRSAGKDYLDGMPQPPKDGSPRENAAWWSGLDAEQQAAWVSMRPEIVGALDGVPSAVRDDANRIVLDETRGRYRTELNAMPKPPANEWTWITAGGYPAKVHTDEWMAWHREYGDRREYLTTSLKGMQHIQDRFDASGRRGLPEAYLLGFSPDGDGRAIIANGNPDTADHQAVYVPGTESDLASIKGNIRRMEDVWRQSDARAGGESVSTITWLGYDAPDDVAKDAPFEHYAYDGAPALNRFLDGLEETHVGESAPHRTVIGHSYGTTLVGAAAETGNLNADDVIFAGSPGVKVSSADEMDVPAGHVWNEEADGDVVPDVGRWGHGGDGFVIPSDHEFGANQMTTDTEGHSGYWDQDKDGTASQSLLNQALVVVGKGGNVPLKPPPDPWAHVK